jgi:hypothetical protein
MLGKILLIIGGLGLLLIAAWWSVVFMLDDGLSNLHRWFLYGGKQNALLFGRAAMWNARLWGSLMCLVPLSLAAGGLWLCRCALEKGEH